MVDRRVLLLWLPLVVGSMKAELSCSADNSKDVNLDVAPEAVNGVVNVTTSLRFTCNVAGVGLEMLTDPRLCFVSVANDTIKILLIHDWDSARQSGTYLFSSIPEVLQGAIVFCVLTDDMEQNLRSQTYRIIVQGPAATPAANDVMPTTSAATTQTTGSAEQGKPSSTANVTANSMSDVKGPEEHKNVIVPLVAVIGTVSMVTTLAVLMVIAQCVYQQRFWKPHHREEEIAYVCYLDNGVYSLAKRKSNDRTPAEVVNIDDKLVGNEEESKVSDGAKEEVDEEELEVSEGGKKMADKEESKFTASKEVVQNSPTAPVVTAIFSESQTSRTRTQRGYMCQRGLLSQVGDNDVSVTQLPSDEASSASGGDRSMSTTYNELVTTPSTVFKELTRGSEKIVEMPLEKAAEDRPAYIFSSI